MLDLSALTFRGAERFVPEWERIAGVRVNPVAGADCIFLAWRSAPLFGQKHLHLTLELELAFAGTRRGVTVKTSFFNRERRLETEVASHRYAFRVVPASFPADLAGAFPEWFAVFAAPYRAILHPLSVPGIAKW
jgi:hypothetical protein